MARPRRWVLTMRVWEGTTMPDVLRVLIVDDDFHVARLHAAYVDSVPGFSALPPVGSGTAAIRAAHTLDPDLVLLDVYLPDMSGLEVLRALDTDTFVITAAADPASVRSALRRGALAYLIKPFPAETLTRRLSTYMRYRNLLHSDHDLDQDTIERARGLMRVGEKAPSRLQDVTRLAVLHVLAARTEPASAVDVAEGLGVSRATAQRYLSSLVDDGTVTMQLRYGSTGRPEHRYSRGPA